MKEMNRLARSTGILIALFAAIGLLPACGYHLQGKGSFLPERIKSIGIPPFQSAVARREIVEKLTEAVTKEFLSRGSYRILPTVEGADATLEGNIVGFTQSPIAFDADGRANRALLTITARVGMQDRLEGSTLYESPAFQYRSEIELSTDGTEFYDPESEAIDSIAKEFARSLVSTIVEGF